MGGKTRAGYVAGGFNLWCSTDSAGGCRADQRALIPAASLGGMWGGSYAYVDAAVIPSTIYHYRLEEAEMEGMRNWCGSVSAGAQTPAAVTILDFALENFGSSTFAWQLWLLRRLLSV
jgi:hypothetical protein